MDSSNLTRSQAKKVNAAIFPKLNYLDRLRKRMQKVGFPHDDPLWVLVEKAYYAMQRLYMETHYLSCNGVGRLPREEGGPADGGAVPSDEEK